MRESQNRTPERFVVLSLAQALLRKGYEVEADHRLLSGGVVDLIAHLPGKRPQIAVEVKVVPTSSQVTSAAAKAREQLSLLKLPKVQRFVAIGIQGTDIVFADAALIALIAESSTDIDLRPLPPVGSSKHRVHLPHGRSTS